MSQSDNLVAFAQAVGADVKELYANQGTLSNLSTTAKNNLVAALNELKSSIASAGGGAVIDDDTASTTTTYSSSEIETKITDAITALVNGAPAAYDTLKELADYVASDTTAMSSLTASLANRVRFDQAQTLTTEQQGFACANIGIGDPTTDLAAAYTTAKS